MLREAVDAAELEATDLAARIAELAHDEINELATDPQTRVELTRGAVGHIAAFARALRRGEPLDRVPPAPEALAAARAQARAGSPLQPVLRVVHFGHQVFLERLTAELASLAGEAQARDEAERLARQHTFRWIDGLTRQLADEYEAEKAREQSGVATARAATVRAVLKGEAHDVDAVSRAMGYELARHHVGLVLWGIAENGQPTALPKLQGAANGISNELAGTKALTIPAGGGLLWAWVSSWSELSSEPFSAGSLPVDRGVSVASGEPGFGIAGFQTSHDEAAEAARLAFDSNTVNPRSWRYRDVELVALLTSDPTRARRFVARELGRLDGESHESAVLRETLRIYLDEGRRRTAAAGRLGIHPNTVTNRVATCVELLGRDLDKPGPGLQVALEVRSLLAGDLERG